MSVTTESIRSSIQSRQPSILGIFACGSWTRIGLGAVALGSYLLLAATSQSPWPVLVAPLFLIGIAQLMGLRSLWPPSSKKRSRRIAPASSLVEKAARHAGAAKPGAQTELASLETEIKATAPQNAIDELTGKTGRTAKERAGNAYRIGRHYMRLGQFEEAREWLLRAASQKKSNSALRDAARKFEHQCNLRLLAEGDACYRSGDLQGARERYARLSQGIPPEEGHSFALFLRTACVYCELQDYEAADQALLHALQSGEQTDQALGLHELLRQLGGTSETTPAKKPGQQAQAALADHVSTLMEGLCAKPQAS